MNTLSSRLIEARTNKGWNKTELKKAAGLKSASTLTDLESGLRTQSPQLPAIAAALGVEVLWLQHGKGDRYRNTPSSYQPPPPPTDPCVEYLAKLPPAIAAKLRLQIKHAYEIWQLEQEGEPNRPNRQHSG